MIRPGSILAGLALAVVMGQIPTPSAALGTGAVDTTTTLVGHSCSFTAFHDLPTGESQVSFTVTGVVQSQSSGGNYWLGSAITSWPGGDILASSVETQCGISGITNFVSDGANGTYASDDFMGVTFRGVSDADGRTYDYVFGISGAATTVLVNSRSEVVNTPPTAEAGPAQTVGSGATVNLDGSGSDANDPGQTLSYAWSQNSGPAVTLQNETTATPSFTAPTLVAGAADATIVLQLVVNDGVENSAPDTVTITVTAPPNTPPTANAGTPQTVASAASVSLDGSGSSANDTGQVLSYVWTQIGTPAVTLVDETTATPDFTAPTLVPGTPDTTLTFRLVVNDGVEDSSPATVSVTVTAPANVSPTADAGPDQTVASGAAVSLDGTGSTPNNAGQTLSYLWTQTSGPDVTLADPGTATPDFTAPTLLPGAANATLVFSLVVNDGIENSTADTVSVTVTAPANVAPTANAGPDQTVTAGAAVTLDGSASDANNPNQPLVFAWTQTGGPNVVLTGDTTDSPTFAAPPLLPGEADIVLTFSLVVNDTIVDSAPDTVVITVTAPANVTPTADAGPDQTVASGATVALDGSGSDPNNPGQTLSYAWSQDSGPAVTLQNDTTATPGFTAPTLAFNAPDAVLVFSLVVDDGIAPSPADTVQITVTAPVDVTSPTATISSAPANYLPATPFTITVSFSEPVTGFVAGDISVTNGTATGLTGSGASYTAEITPSGTADPIGISVAAGVAQDAAGNFNTAATPVSVLPNTSGLAEEAIVEALTARARALIGAQPDLRALFGGGGFSGVSADVTRGIGTFRFGLNGDSRFWMLAQGTWSTSGTTDLDYFNLAFGSHLYRGDNLLIGAMLQLDQADATLETGTFEGRGWLAGPYLVARLPDQPLVFSASVLHGRSDNTLTLTGQAPDDFSSTRTLVTAGIEGQFAVADGLTLIPSLDLARVIDRQDGYVDSLSNPVSAQTIRLTEASFGLGFERLVRLRDGTLVLTGGLNGIYSSLDTPTEQSDSFRGRVDLGAEITLGGGTTARFGAYYDGIGLNDYEAFGATAALEVRF